MKTKTRKELFIKVEFDPKGNPDTCNVFDTEYCYLSFSELDKYKWDVITAFMVKTNLNKECMYFYTVDEIYIKIGNDYLLYDEDF